MNARRLDLLGKTIVTAAVVLAAASGALAQVNETAPPPSPASAPAGPVSPSGPNEGGVFVILSGEDVLNYNTDVSGVNANKARGWGYGGAIGSIGPTGGLMIRGEYFPKITVPGDSYDLYTSRYDVELHGFVGGPRVEGLNSLFDLGFKYVHVKDNINAVSFEETENWYLANIGYDFTLPIGSAHSPVIIFGTIAGLVGWADDSGDGGSVSGLAYGYTATAGLALSFWDGALRLAGGYKIQDLRANDSSSGNFGKFAEDQLQSVFAQLTWTF